MKKKKQQFSGIAFCNETIQNFQISDAKKKKKPEKLVLKMKIKRCGKKNSCTNHKNECRNTQSRKKRTENTQYLLSSVLFSGWELKSSK